MYVKADILEMVPGNATADGSLAVEAVGMGGRLVLPGGEGRAREQQKDQQQNDQSFSASHGSLSSDSW